MIVSSHDIDLRAGRDQSFGDLAGIAGRKQAVGNDVAGHRVHAAGGEQVVGENGIVLRSDARQLAVHRQPALVIVEQRAVLVEENALDACQPPFCSISPRPSFSAAVLPLPSAD